MLAGTAATVPTSSGTLVWMSSGNATGASARFGSKTIRASPLATAKSRVSKPRAIGPATCAIGSALAWPHARCSTQQCWSRQRWLGGIRRFSSCRAALRGAPLGAPASRHRSDVFFGSCAFSDRHLTGVLVPALHKRSPDASSRNTTPR